MLPPRLHLRCHDIEPIYRSVGGSLVFAKMDLCHSYLLVLLTADSHDVMSIETVIHVHTPTRIS